MQLILSENNCPLLTLIHYYLLLTLCTYGFPSTDIFTSSLYNRWLLCCFNSFALIASQNLPLKHKVGDKPTYNMQNLLCLKTQNHPHSVPLVMYWVNNHGHKDIRTYNTDGCIQLSVTPFFSFDGFSGCSFSFFNINFCVKLVRCVGRYRFLSFWVDSLHICSLSDSNLQI